MELQPTQPSSPRSTATPEAAIALIGLYVAVVSVANTLGGSGGSIAAAILGVAMTVVVGADVRRVRGTARATTAAIAAAALSLAVLSAAVAFEHWRDDKAEGDIVGVIEGAYEHEIDWYKHPEEARRTQLEQFFVRPDQGGERLAVIETAIERLRRCQYRLGEEARATSFVKEVEVDGHRARALAAESIFQPTYAKVGGKWQRRDVGELFYTEDQIYVLEKVDGAWKIASAPQQQSTREC